MQYNLARLSRGAPYFARKKGRAEEGERVYLARVKLASHRGKAVTGWLTSCLSYLQVKDQGEQIKCQLFVQFIFQKSPVG